MPIPVDKEFNTVSWPVLNKIAINARIINLGVKDESIPKPEEAEEKTDERELPEY